MRDIFIFGTGGFAREVADIVFACGDKPILIANNISDLSAYSGGVEAIVEERIDQIKNGVFVIGIGENSTRRLIYQRYRHLDFVNVFHPSATFGIGQRALVEAGSGNIVCAGVRMTNSIKVGDFVIINLNATIGHDVQIDSFVNIAPGANISGFVHVEEGVWIGTNGAINQGSRDASLRLGSNTTVGSGSVVVKSCEADSIYVGVPARKR